MGSTDVDKLTVKDSQGKMNGPSVVSSQESEEVYIVVNKNTSVKKKVCMLVFFKITKKI